LAEKILPNVDGLSANTFGRFKFSRFDRLNACASTSRDLRSATMKRRERARSTETRPGERRIFRPAFPNVYLAGIANAAVLNHICVFGFAKCGLPTTFGRSDPKVPPVLPVLLLSNLKTGVKGWPDCAVIIAELSKCRR